MEGKLKFKEMIMMNVILKHIVEIAGGLVLGGLTSDAVNKVVDVAKKKVANSKKG